MYRDGFYSPRAWKVKYFDTLHRFARVLWKVKISMRFSHTKVIGRNLFLYNIMIIEIF
jgi:hypothetical protein